jgi:hypothetical protein
VGIANNIRCSAGRREDASIGRIAIRQCLVPADFGCNLPLDDSDIVRYKWLKIADNVGFISMRDGIPRTIPVARKWQMFVACADRKADRGTERVVDQFLEAIHETMSRQFPAEKRKILAQACEDTQPTLPGIESPKLSDLRAPLGDHDAQMDSILDDADRGIRAGQESARAIRGAVAAKMQTDADAHLRQIREDLAGKCTPSELKQVSVEMTRAASQVNWLVEADRFLEPSLRTAKAASLKVAPDEDLR